VCIGPVLLGDFLINGYLLAHLGLMIRPRPASFKTPIARIVVALP
jgi:hypothetical protein